MAWEPPLDREDVVSMMRALLDIRANIERILEYLEDEYGEEEET
jgi:hypothetical protein